MDFPRIDPSELLSLPEYKARRESLVAEVIKIKDLRRVEVGPWASFVFENKATVIHQIHEMLRIEHISDPAKIRHEIETYEELLPAPGELSATFFIEIPDADTRRRALSSLGGVEKAIALRVGDLRAPAEDKRPIDPRFERLGQATAVYYLRFKVSAPAAAALREGGAAAWLEISHPRYSHAARLSEACRLELSRDLAGR